MNDEAKESLDFRDELVNELADLCKVFYTRANRCLSDPKDAMIAISHAFTTAAVISVTAYAEAMGFSKQASESLAALIVTSAVGSILESVNVDVKTK